MVGIRIYDQETFAGHVREDDTVKVGVKLKVDNNTADVVDGYTVRFILTGKNSRKEPVELVLNQHMHLVPGRNEVTLEGTLFYPILSTRENPYIYYCRINLYDDKDLLLADHFNQIEIWKD